MRARRQRQDFIICELYNIFYKHNLSLNLTSVTQEIHISFSYFNENISFTANLIINIYFITYYLTFIGTFCNLMLCNCIIYNFEIINYFLLHADLLQRT